MTDGQIRSIAIATIHRGIEQGASAEAIVNRLQAEGVLAPTQSQAPPAKNETRTEGS
jgi:hypothetical protein